MNISYAVAAILAALLLAVGGESVYIVVNHLGSLDGDIRIEKVGTLDTLTVDASRRAVIVAYNGHFCSEPVPDAMNSLVKQFAASASGKNDKTEGAAQLAEFLKSDVNKLFERSQGIQVLRDGMYRLCEAFVNNAISPEAFEEHMSDLEETLNFIVPIELCSKLNSDIIASISGAGLLRKPDAASGKPAAFDAAAASPAPDAAAQKSGELAAVFENSEVLSSKFIDSCIKYGYNFASLLAASSDQRSSARHIANRLAESAAPGAFVDAGAASGAKPGPTPAAINPYVK